MSRNWLFVFVGVVPKSTNPEHIKNNFEIFDFVLSQEDMERLSGLHKDHHYYYNPYTVTWHQAAQLPRWIQHSVFVSIWKCHSNYMALVTLMDNLINCLENGEYVIGIFLDFSKALDIVDHSILLQKLFLYGIWGTPSDWFQSYLTNRYQFATYNWESFERKKVKCGVPQGWILWPLYQKWFSRWL